MAEAAGGYESPDYEQLDHCIDDDHESLRELVVQLQKDDAVIEPAIIKTFEDFLEMGGETRSGIRHLSGSYKGLSAMINTLIEWLTIAGYRKKDIHSKVEEHLKGLVLKHFDPKKADLIFTEEGSTPSWLEDMIGFQTWRELFYQLADQYPDCLMLKFTTKLISDAGYQGEIKSISTAAHQPEVYCGLVRNCLTDILASNATDLAKNVEDFAQLVCHSQHTYFYAQAMIKTIEQHQPDHTHFTQWLSREIQHVAVKRKLDITNMTLHFNGVGSHPKVFEALSSMLSRNALNPADVTTLYRCYSEDNVSPPPVRFLWNSQFLELLVQALFRPDISVNPEHKEKYVYLLAYATSVREVTRDFQDVPLKEELLVTQEAIDSAHGICSSANDSHTELLTNMATLFTTLRYPIVSMGVFRWVESTLMDTSFFEISAETSSLFLVLLDEIAACNYLQHPLVFDLLKKLLERSYNTMEDNTQVELKRNLLYHLTHLIAYGHVIPVISYINKCMENETLDNSLVRSFITEVLSIIEPPYSSEFTAVFLPLLQNKEIAESLVVEGRQDPVSQFMAECPKKSKKKNKRSARNH